MERKIIYVDNVGYVDPKVDHELIIWFWEQQLKGRKPNLVTSFWLKTKKNLWNRLLTLQAYELMAKISQNVTEAQEKRSAYNEKRRKEKAALELEGFKKMGDEIRFHNSLLKRALCEN